MLKKEEALFIGSARYMNNINWTFFPGRLYTTKEIIYFLENINNLDEIIDTTQKDLVNRIFGSITHVSVKTETNNFIEKKSYKKTRKVIIEISSNKVYYYRNKIPVQWKKTTIDNNDILVSKYDLQYHEITHKELEDDLVRIKELVKTIFKKETELHVISNINMKHPITNDYSHTINNLVSVLEKISYKNGIYFHNIGKYIEINYNFENSSNIFVKPYETLTKKGKLIISRYINKFILKTKYSHSAFDKQILTITSEQRNGKGNEELIHFDNYGYIHNCEIVNNKVVINSNPIDFKYYNILICDFNEDAIRSGGETNAKFKKFHTVISFYIKICEIAKRENEHIIIYQDPRKCLFIRDTHSLYSTLESVTTGDDIFNIPKCTIINDLSSLDDIDFYPLLFKGKKGLAPKIITSSNDIPTIIDGLKNNSNLAIQYVNSQLLNLKSNHLLRLVIVNDTLIDYYLKVSNKWNIQMKNINIDKIKSGTNFIKPFIDENINEINNYIKKVHAIYGNGFYVWDVIIQNNKMYICNIGLKYFDYFLKNTLKNNYYTKSIDTKYMRNYYTNILQFSKK